jgi:ribosomal-protein-alanine N-acetyltransferase
MEAIRIRRMELGDLPAVMSLEREIFRSPWSEAAFLQELAMPHSLPLVAQENDRIVGYAIAWFVADEVHLTNLAVAPDLRRRGVGTRLMEAILHEARRQGQRLLTLEVRMSNTGAQRFYERFGLRAVAIRKGYYSDDGEDALVMLTELPGRRNDGEG